MLSSPLFWGKPALGFLSRILGVLPGLKGFGIERFWKRTRISCLRPTGLSLEFKV